MGQDQSLGSIEKGKLADFFLIPGDPTQHIKAVKTISLVAKEGVFYFPSEIYPQFGILPFVAAPHVVAPQTPALRAGNQDRRTPEGAARSYHGAGL